MEKERKKEMRVGSDRRGKEKGEGSPWFPSHGVAADAARSAPTLPLERAAGAAALLAARAAKSQCSNTRLGRAKLRKMALPRGAGAPARLAYRAGVRGGRDRQSPEERNARGGAETMEDFYFSCGTHHPTHSPDNHSKAREEEWPENGNGGHFLCWLSAFPRMQPINNPGQKRPRNEHN